MWTFVSSGEEGGFSTICNNKKATLPSVDLSLSDEETAIAGSQDCSAGEREKPRPGLLSVYSYIGCGLKSQLSAAEYNQRKAPTNSSCATGLAPAGRAGQEEGVLL